MNVDFQLSFGLEGRPVFNKDEEPMKLKASIWMLLDDYDSVRPSTVFYNDINGDLSKGYIGWRKG